MKRNISLILLLMLFIFGISNSQDKYKVQKITDKNGYEYETVNGDPLKLRIYTLKNGLKVYLRHNSDEPRVQTLIAVKAGSTFDPPTTTGLAHYLEHLMFKGTGNFGTTNYQIEEKYLAEISNLFEKHKLTGDSIEKKAVYHAIDSVSQIAAKYAIASEYDKMVTSIGAKGTNAYTSEERTVYVNDIPSNEFEKWLMLESERFGKLVMRLFHTELETVYEEFNMSQDNDYNKVNEAYMAMLFTKHPYGTQTTIGTAEHLKNPSMLNIQNYWYTYYVPNNMAICLSGDLDFENTIKLIDKYWGAKKPGNIPIFTPPVEDAILKPISKNISGPDVEFVNISFRMNGYKTEDRKYATLIDYMLTNSTAGLIDLDLVQKQKVLEANTYAEFFTDYGVFNLMGKAKQNQSLEEVRDLLLGEIEKIKNGKFEDWLIPAILDNVKIEKIKRQESNSIAHTFVDCFAYNLPWIEYVKFNDELEKLTKKDLVNFAKRIFNNNYAIVYKHTGKDSISVKVNKPQITAVDLNRENQSEYLKNFNKKETPHLTPVFVDYKSAIQKSTLKSGVELNTIQNANNELFNLSFVLDMGGNQNLKLPLAADYLNYIGTDKFTPENFKKELYKIGISFEVFSGNDRTYVTISGLQKNMEKGLQLLEQILNNPKPDKEIYNDFINGLIKKRADAKLDKYEILYSGLMNYAMYGNNSPFTHILQENELKSINPKELTDIIKEMFSYKHYAFYYGPDSKNVDKLVEKYHKVSKLKDYPQKVKFVEQEFKKPKIYFVNYDMVQTMLLFLSKDLPFDKTLIPYARVFNEYYGAGLSSIVFQEIREAKGLAYTAYAAYSTPSKLDRSNYVFGFLASQADKLKDATDAFMGLMKDMPKADKQLESSKDAIIKKIESERIVKSQIFWNYIGNKDLNINYDIRKDVYELAKKINIDDINNFFNSHIKGKQFAFLLIGSKDKVDFKMLEKYGEVKELTLQEVFNY